MTDLNREALDNMNQTTKNAIFGIALIALIFVAAGFYQNLQSQKAIDSYSARLTLEGSCTNLNNGEIANSLFQFDEEKKAKDSTSNLQKYVSIVRTCEYKDYKNSSIRRDLLSMLKASSNEDVLAALDALSEAKPELLQDILSKGDISKGIDTDILLAIASRDKMVDGPLKSLLAQKYASEIAGLQRAKIQVAEGAEIELQKLRKPSEFIAALKLLGVIQKALLAATRFETILPKNSNQETHQPKIDALLQMESSIQMMSQELSNLKLDGRAVEQIAVIRRIPSAESSGYLFEGAIIDLPTEGRVVFKADREDEFRGGVSHRRIIFPSGTIRMNMQDGQAREFPLYFVFPGATFRKISDGIAIMHKSTRDYLKMFNEVLNESSAEDQRNSQQSPESEDSELKKRVSSEITALENNNSFADIASADNSALVKAMIEPKSLQDWRYLKRLDETYSKDSNCQEAACHAISATIKRALVQAQSIMKFSGTTPPEEVGFNFRVLQAAGK